MSEFFDEAYRRARSRFTAEQWLAMAPQQITEAIYQAMREMDAAAAAQAEVRPRPKSTRATRGSDRAER